MLNEPSGSRKEAMENITLTRTWTENKKPYILQALLVIFMSARFVFLSYKALSLALDFRSQDRLLWLYTFLGSI